MTGIWDPTPTPALPDLDDLRQAILRLGRTRRPIWRFRIAADMIISLQPCAEYGTRVAYAHRDAHTALIKEQPRLDDWRDRYEATLTRHDYLFRGRTLVGPVGWTDVEHPPRDVPYVDLRYDVYVESDGGRYLCLTHCSRSPGNRDAEQSSIARLRDALTAEAFTNFGPSAMLSGRCVICGKKLTDAASLARLIGPECWGSTSIRVPWVYSAVALTA